jgi:hypothetical protein
MTPLFEVGDIVRHMVGFDYKYAYGEKAQVMEITKRWFTLDVFSVKDGKPTTKKFPACECVDWGHPAPHEDVEAFTDVGHVFNRLVRIGRYKERLTNYEGQFELTDIVAAHKIDLTPLLAQLKAIEKRLETLYDLDSEREDV